MLEGIHDSIVDYFITARPLRVCFRCVSLYALSAAALFAVSPGPGPLASHLRITKMQVRCVSESHYVSVEITGFQNDKSVHRGSMRCMLTQESGSHCHVTVVFRDVNSSSRFAVQVPRLCCRGGG